MNLFQRVVMLPATLSASIAIGGCGGGTELARENVPSQQVRSSPKIKELMGKLTKGTNSLTPTIGKELNLAQPPWATIQGQTKDFVRLANELGRAEPPIGSNASWAKLTSAYAGSAAELDGAAQSRQKEAAIASLGRLATSCKACHTAHRPTVPKGGTAQKG